MTDQTEQPEPTPPPALPAAVHRFLDAVDAAPDRWEIRVLDDSTRTAPQAANALGCDVERIAKSIVFRRSDDDAGVVVVTAGDQRVDPAKLASFVGEVGRADAEFVRRTTGYVIGGVPPAGHPDQVVVLLDRSLWRFDQVWAAAGHPHAVFAIGPDELGVLTGCEPVDCSVPNG